MKVPSVRNVSRAIALPIAQASILLVSLSSFAVLSRHLGPLPFARFATLLFIFTIVALLFDLSAQGFILTRSDLGSSLPVAWVLTLCSIAVGLVALILALLLFGGYLPGGGRPNIVEQTLLSVSFVAQLAAQLPRASMVLNRRYIAMGVIDFGSIAISSILVIALTTVTTSSAVLLMQFAIQSILRLALSLLSTSSSRKSFAIPTWPSLASGFSFGLSAIPLNVGAYASRSIDSGLLPLIVNPSLAATYARSFQTVVAPLTQLQLSVGPVVLRGLTRRERLEDVIYSAKLWKWMLTASWAAGGVGLALAPLIDRILFGPQWEHVVSTVRAMCVCLPGMFAVAVTSWHRQIAPNLRVSFIHLFVVLTGPSVVVCTAASTGYEQCLGALVLMSGVVVPVALTFVHDDVLPHSRERRCFTIILTTGSLIGLFALSAL